jgi:hypothetical protein
VPESLTGRLPLLWQDDVHMPSSVRPPAAGLLLAASLLCIAPAAGAQSQPALQAYAVLGLESVRIGRGVRVQRGAVGAAAGSVRLAAGARVQGSVVAESVRIARRSQVGRLFCRLVSGGGFGPGVVGGPRVGGSTSGCRDLAVPVVDPALLPPVAVVPGSADLVVPARSGSSPVAAGAFGAVLVGRGAVLQLAGGSYQVRSIRLARAARLVCLDDCQIGVAETVRLGRHAQLGAGQGFIRASRARVDVVGTPDAVAFRTGPMAVVAATVFAPGGAVLLGPRGDYRGAYIGRTVTLRPRSRMREDSALEPTRG